MEDKEKVERLKNALTELIGVRSKKDLKLMEAAIQDCPAPKKERIAWINAIHAVLDAME